MLMVTGRDTIIFMIFGLSLYSKINKNSIILNNLEPPETYRDLNVLEINTDEVNLDRTPQTLSKPLNTLV